MTGSLRNSVHIGGSKVICQLNGLKNLGLRLQAWLDPGVIRKAIAMVPCCRVLWVRRVLEPDPPPSCCCSDAYRPSRHRRRHVGGSGLLRPGFRSWGFCEPCDLESLLSGLQCPLPLNTVSNSRFALLTDPVRGSGETRLCVEKPEARFKSTAPFPHPVT